jgi:hypothetical protein
MQLRNSTLRRLGLGAGSALLCAAGLCAGLTAPPADAQTKTASETLYKLETTCSIKRGPVQDCVIEAVNEGDATLYRHKIGNTVEIIRVTDAPVSMSRWDAASKGWVVLNSAGARFSTNTICFNDRDLCVVNPNYLNSVREEKVDALAGRDLVGVKFSRDGRVSLTCYDEACEGVN